MKNLEKEAANRQLKLAKAFKAVISAGLVAPVFVSVSSCKEAPAVVEEEQQIEEKPAAEDPTTVKEGTAESKEETPLVVEEEAPAPVEYEGIIIPQIEGLRFEEGTFFAEAGNPYSLEEGEKAGVFVKDAVEINGVIESSIGLRPEVIEFLQKKIMEEKKEFKYPLPFNFEEAKGIKIKEVADTRADEWTRNDGVFWDDNFYLEISNVPLKTKIYAPVTTLPGRYLVWDNDPDRDDFYIFSFVPNLAQGKELFRDEERIDGGGSSIKVIGAKLLPEGFEKNIVSHGEDGTMAYFESEIKIGEPVAEVVFKEEYLNQQYWDKKSLPDNPSDEPSMRISSSLAQLKNPDEPMTSVEQLSKSLERGIEGLLKLEDSYISFY